MFRSLSTFVTRQYQYVCGLPCLSEGKKARGREAYFILPRYEFGNLDALDVGGVVGWHDQKGDSVDSFCLCEKTADIIFSSCNAAIDVHSRSRRVFARVFDRPFSHCDVSERRFRQAE